MTIPLVAVAVSFTIATLFCVADMAVARFWSIKAFRLFQSIICAIAASYYYDAMAHEVVPSINLRVVWIALCVVICAEIISRQSWGTKSK